ncbi:eye-specific diacylglycerol kinase [Formica exsecta]|uniref:eye-specific diacylglycerol kinase n=1 Tax=Formica exsecta TaxID=72781 RepID=UPI001143FBF1|nr:eye-specific diacylglycerol kinase [Formica exsecta]
MQRLRSTFKRSRTPTGAEMKSQSSLEVPKQIRSASFDEIQLQAKGRDDRTNSSSSSTCSSARSQDSTRVRRGSSTLKVPQLQTGQRSKSFDAYSGSSGSFAGHQLLLGGIERPETPIIQVSGCYHCACVEEYRNLWLAEDFSKDEAEAEGLQEADSGNSDLSENESDHEDESNSKREGSPEIRVILTPDDVPSEPRCVSPIVEIVPELDSEIKVLEFSEHRQRRRSLASPKLSRQEALTTFPLEPPAVPLETTIRPTVAADDDDDDDDDDENDVEPSKSKLVVRDIFLTVPELKRDRAASVDSCFNNNKNGGVSDADLLAVPQQSIRSKSVDIVLPTDVRTRYTALLPGKESRLPIGWVRLIKWTQYPFLNITRCDQISSLYLLKCLDVKKHGPRLKCPACRVVTHACCVASLEFACKPSFRDVGVRQYREQTTTHHHWVHRRYQKGKCANCGKSFQSKLSFSSREIVAVSCSWCKIAYHNKEACFNVHKIGENCELGTHESIIVPPSWIVKLPRKGSFKSSLRRSPRKKKSGGGSGSSGRRKSKDKEKEEREKEKDQGELWIVKPIPTATVKPVLVFINPKSGGNQGAKLLQKFQWLLNPRQVFDLTQGGPKMGLELFKKVPNLRILACGGDGTVGWVLSILDQIGAYPAPAVGVLPLGTGNDLARALGWGGGYKDEPIGKILTSIGDSETTLLDRWQLKVEKNDAKSDDDGGKGKENLPLNVVNNYFSLGVDAHIALEFHEAREAHPEKFNSRMRNKLFYGQMGCKDLLLTKWKDLSDFVTLECDGQDMTPKLKEHRVHAILFLNIASYGGGTHPWSASSGTREPAMDDGLIEVVGLTTYQLPLLQARGHGTCIVQCSTAKLVTTKTIPMQVDGEACRLLPSIITLSMLNKATMLTKRRNAGKPNQNIAKLERLKLPVMKIKMSDYETYYHDKERLKEAAELWLAEPLDLDATTDLETLRKLLAKDYNVDSCCFLDSCTTERFFRIDRGQEQLHYVTDVAVEAVYVLDEDTVQQHEGQIGSSQIIANQEMETARVNFPSDEHLKEKPAVTEERRTSNVSKDAEKQRRSSIVQKTRLSGSISFDKESDDQNVAVKSKNPANRNSLDVPSPSEDVNIESNSLINRESLKQNSRVVIAHTDQSHQHQDRPLAFISPRDRLFSLSSGVHGFNTELLEKNCDDILRAAKIGDLSTLKQLHQKGYSLLSIDETGQTALHLASKNGHKDIVRYLIACAPPTILNMIDNDKGQTALHKAAQNKRRSICCMLVAGGASLMVKDRHGNTPHQLALIAEDHDLAAYLQSQKHFQLATDEMESDL